MIINTEQKPIERVMDNAFTRLKTLVDADTVIGKPLILEDGTGIVPISRIVMGFLTGGGEYSDMTGKSCEFPFAGGSGVGASVVPVGFLIKKDKDYKIINVGDKSLYDKILSLVPEALESVTNVFSKDKKK